MLDKHKQNYAVVENGKLLMCGRKFILGALTLIIHDDEGMFWGRLYAIDDEFNKSEDIKVLRENDNDVYFGEARKDEVEFMEKDDEKEVTWNQTVETVAKTFLHDRDPQEEVTMSAVADWEYNNELFKDVAEWVNEELELEEDGE